MSTCPDLLDDLQTDPAERLCGSVLCCTEMHTRNTLFFVQQGYVEVCCGVQTLQVSPREVVFLPEKCKAKIRFFAYKEGPQKSAYEADVDLGLVCIAFDASVHGTGLFALLQWSVCVVVEGDAPHRIAVAVLEESERRRLGRQEMMRAFAMQLCVLLIRDGGQLPEQAMLHLRSATLALQDLRFRRLCRYVSENLSSDLSNRKLSSLSNVSEDYLGEYFRGKSRTTPQEYVEYQRLKRAMTWLRTTKASIGQISKRVGFRDVSYFCRRFQKMFGTSATSIKRILHTAEVDSRGLEC